MKNMNLLKLVTLLVAITAVIVSLSLMGAAGKDMRHKSQFSVSTTVVDEPIHVFKHQVADIYGLHLAIDSLEGQSLQVSKGSLVKFLIFSDVNCYFDISKYDIYEWVPRGATKEVTIAADKAGVYEYSCGPAGKGTLTIN